MLSLVSQTPPGVWYMWNKTHAPGACPSFIWVKVMLPGWLLCSSLMTPWHFGQLAQADVDALKSWILAGAPEK